MKRIIFIVTVIVFFTLPVNAQKGKGPMHGLKFREKIEQLEKLKLIEVLNLDGETTLRFFARQSKNRDENMKLMDKKDKLVNLLKDHFTDGVDLPKGEDFKSLNNQIIEIEKKMINKRISFLNSLTDILTEEQISKLIVFESNFRQEIRDMILDKRGGGPPMQR